jgi:hypothetical protein
LSSAGSGNRVVQAAILLVRHILHGLWVCFC